MGRRPGAGPRTETEFCWVPPGFDEFQGRRPRRPNWIFCEWKPPARFSTTLGLEEAGLARKVFRFVLCSKRRVEIRRATVLPQCTPHARGRHSALERGRKKI